MDAPPRNENVINLTGFVHPPHPPVFPSHFPLRIPSFLVSSAHSSLNKNFPPTARSPLPQSSPLHPPSIKPQSASILLQPRPENEFLPSLSPPHPPLLNFLLSRLLKNRPVLILRYRSDCHSPFNPPFKRLHSNRLSSRMREQSRWCNRRQP